MHENSVNLYIHVPFCIKKCNYCAFYSVCPDEIDWEKYTKDILRQAEWFDIKSRRIETIFFGGGTPSLMPVKYAEKIISGIGHLVEGAEWTIEANPKTLSSLNLKDWRDLGLNRLSIGMQSFSDEELKFLGRIHTVKDSLKLLDVANDLGLRTSGDFIYGLPGQTEDDVRNLCERINDVAISHASLYELSLEQGTKFANLDPVPNDLAYSMYVAIQKTLRLPRYEVSNYGDPCIHNLNVWKGREYVGLGESAAGRIIKDDEWHETKITNGEVIAQKITPRARAIEKVITGLRTKDGIATGDKDIMEIIDWSFVDSHPQCFLRSSESLKVSDDSLVVLDYVLEGLIK